MPPPLNLSQWLKLLRRLREENALTPKETQLYYGQMNLITMKVRPQVRQSDPFPIRLRRCKRGEWLFKGSLQGLRVTIDGKLLLDDPYFSPVEQDEIPSIANQPEKSCTVDLASDALDRQFDLSTLAPGPHVVECSTTYLLALPVSRDPGDMRTVYSQQRILSGDMEILPRDAPPPVRISGLSPFKDWLETHMAFPSLHVRGHSDRASEVDVRIAPPMATGRAWKEAEYNGAFDMILRIGGVQTKCQELISVKGFPFQVNPETDWVTVPRFEADQISVVLRSNPKLALRTVDVFETPDGEVEFVGVPVDRRSPTARLVKQLLEHENVFQRAAAARALGKMVSEAEEAVPALCTALKDTEFHGQVSKAAVEALAELGALAAESQRDVIGLLNNTDVPDRVCAEAAWALAMIGADESVAIRALSSALRTGGLLIRSRALDALNQFGPAAIPAISDALADEDLGIRNRAILGLGRKGEGAIPVLVDALGRHAADKDVIRLVCRTLFDFGEKARPGLLQALEGENEDIRESARQILRAMDEGIPP